MNKNTRDGYHSDHSLGASASFTKTKRQELLHQKWELVMFD